MTFLCAITQKHFAQNFAKKGGELVYFCEGNMIKGLAKTFKNWPLVPKTPIFYPWGS